MDCAILCFAVTSPPWGERSRSQPRVRGIRFSSTGIERLMVIRKPSPGPERPTSPRGRGDKFRKLALSN
jgi:hypothetical protein